MMNAAPMPDPVAAELLAIQPTDVAAQFAAERAAVAQVAATAQPRLWLWRPGNAIVLTSREQGLLGSAAARSIEQQGWPVIVRDCGGGPVALGPACLNVSWLTPVPGAVSIEQGYLDFCRPVLAAMAALGVHAYCDALPGSYCDGQFNLLVAGRKLAGTSQRVYRTTSGSVRLSHAVLHVLPGVAEQLTWLNHFLGMAKSAQPLAPEYLISTADVIGGAAPEELYQTVYRALALAFNPEPGC